MSRHREPGDTFKGIKRVKGDPLPYNGVIVRKRDVKNHRYLKAHGLSYSESLASVSWGY